MGQSYSSNLDNIIIVAHSNSKPIDKNLPLNTMDEIVGMGRARLLFSHKHIAKHRQLDLSFG